MPGLIGKKVGMTSIFNEQGKNIPCTVLEVGPCVVTQVRTLETDGYEAIQLGYGEKKAKMPVKHLRVILLKQKRLLKLKFKNSKVSNQN